MRVHPPVDEEPWDADPTRRRRRAGVVTGLSSFTLLVALLPLAVAFSLTPSAWTARIWFSTALAQIVLATISAVLLFGARRDDRTRRQTFCAWAGGFSVAAGIVGVSAVVCALVLASLLAAPVSWYGVFAG